MFFKQNTLNGLAAYAIGVIFIFYAIGATQSTWRALVGEYIAKTECWSMNQPKAFFCEIVSHRFDHLFFRSSFEMFPISKWNMHIRVHWTNSKQTKERRVLIPIS